MGCSWTCAAVWLQMGITFSETVILAVAQWAAGCLLSAAVTGAHGMSPEPAPNHRTPSASPAPPTGARRPILPSLPVGVQT